MAHGAAGKAFLARVFISRAKFSPRVCDNLLHESALCFARLLLAKAKVCATRLVFLHFRSFPPPVVYQKLHACINVCAHSIKNAFC